MATDVRTTAVNNGAEERQRRRYNYIDTRAMLGKADERRMWNDQEQEGEGETRSITRA